MTQKYVKLGIIIFPIFCLLFSFFILITDPKFTYLLLENPEALEPTEQLFKYFAGTAEIPDIFDQEEKAHLEDVAMVIRGAFILLILVVLGLLAAKQYRQSIRQGTLLLLIILALILLVPFDSLFTGFHQIVFPQGGWTFAPESTLIRFYPMKLFATCTLAIALHAILTAGVLLGFEIVSRRG